MKRRVEHLTALALWAAAWFVLPFVAYNRTI